MRRRLALLAILVALVALGGAAAPRPVSAHAFLQRTQPTNGAIVATNIGEVRLSFNEPVDVRPDRISVSDGAGRRIDLRDARRVAGDPATVVVSLPQLPSGVYTVRYALISTDTHPVTGSFRFGVGVSPADVQSGATTQETQLSGPLLLQAVARWLNLLGIILFVGPIAFRFLVLAPPWRREQPEPGDAVRRFEARNIRWAWVAVTLLIIGQFLALAAASLASTFGSFGEAFQPDNLLGTLTGRFGTLWLARFALLLVPSLALPIVSAEQELAAVRPDAPQTERGRGAWLAMLISGAALAVLTAFSGHAAATAPVAVTVLVDWLHLSASALWIGGLLALALIIPGVIRALGPSEGLATLGVAVPRFSALAFACIQVLALTGFYQTWAHVDGPTSIGQTLYGRALIAKLLLLIPLLALGAISRLVILPRLRAALAAARDGGDAEARATTRRLWRTVWGEVALGVVVLAAVGLLTALPPARSVTASAATDGGSVAPASSGSVTIAGSAGTTLVNLSIGPTGTGPATLAVTLRDPNGTPIDDATVALRLLPPDGAAPQDVALTARGGRYTGLGELGRTGTWQIEATVTLRGAQPTRTLLKLDLPSGGASAILGAADAAMNRLTSLRERETIAAGGPATTTSYEWVAPDRMHLTSTAGSETIVIGKQRFDRATGGPWVASDWPEPNGYRWPQFSFARSAAEVTILGREEVDGVMCWVIGFLDTAGDARYTFWIGEDDNLIRQQRMFAVGHYMESRYTDFNAPLTITAP